MEIGTVHVSPLLMVFFTLLALFAILAFRRRVKKDGKWELGKRTRTAWTDAVTGTSFAGNAVLMPNELGSRRKKFGKTVWSWTITMVVACMVGVFLNAIGVF